MISTRDTVSTFCADNGYATPTFRITRPKFFFTPTQARVTVPNENPKVIKTICLGGKWIICSKFSLHLPFHPESDQIYFTGF